MNPTVQWSENREYLKVLINVVLFLSKQELAFCGHRENEEVILELLALLSKHDHEFQCRCEY